MMEFRQKKLRTPSPLKILVVAFLFLCQIPPSAGASLLVNVGDSGNTQENLNNLSLIPIAEDHFVTAARTDAGKLKIILWEISYTGQIVRVAEASEATSEKVALVAGAFIGKDTFITAIADGKNFKIIPWRIKEYGGLGVNIERLSNYSVDFFSEGTPPIKTISQIEAVTVSEYAENGSQYIPSHIVIARRYQFAEFGISSWTIDLDGDPTKFATTGNVDIAVKQVRHMSVAAVGSQVMASYVNASLNNNVENFGLALWSFGADKKIQYSYLAHGMGESTLFTDIVPIRDREFITAFRTTNGNLQLISWQELSASVVKRHAHTQGLLQVASVRAANLGRNNLVTGVITPDNELRCALIHVHANGSMERVTTTETEVGQIDIFDITSLSDERFVVAVKNIWGHLRLIAWERAPSLKGLENPVPKP